MKYLIQTKRREEILKDIVLALTIISAIITIVTLITTSKTTIIIGAILFFSICFLYLTYRLVVKYYKNRKIFCDRDDATPFMIKDLIRYKHLAFIGVSHKKLHDYLEKAIKLNKEKTLPWESIMVFFATDELGKVWEPNDFNNNIKQSMINIVNILFDENYKKLIPNLNMVQFRQCKSTYKFSSFSGCFLGEKKNNDSSVNLQVIYSTNHLPIGSQTENSWTIRLKMKTDPLFKEFENSFHKIEAEAEIISDIKFSLWEWSTGEWNSFVRNYEYFEKGIDFMLNELNMNDKHILDVGSGTGNAANYIIDKFPQAKFTLVDASSNMLREAKKIIGDKATYELFQLPSLTSDYFIRNNKDKYDYIISHLSLQSIINNSGEFSSFVSNCNNMLKSRGCVVLAIHNSYDIQLDQDRQNDKFRIDLTNEIDKIKDNGSLIDKKEKKNIGSLITVENIRKTFEEKHFKEIYFNTFELPFTMPDRKRLWEIPAVLGSLVDIESIGISTGKEMVKKASAKNKNFETPDRKMIVFHFQKKSGKIIL